LTFEGLRFRVKGKGSRVFGLGSRVLGSEVKDFRLKTWVGSGFRV